MSIKKNINVIDIKLKFMIRITVKNSINITNI